MKKFLAAAAILSVTSTAAFADAKYPVEIVKDGVFYNCAAELVVVDGVDTRRCVTVGSQSGSGGGLFALGLGGFGASLGLVAAIVTVSVIAADDEDSTTNGTN